VSAALENGMRVVELPVASRLATAIAVSFPAGSRHEGQDEVGAAHALEHLVFKGTENHPSATELNRAAELLGTELEGESTTDYVEFSVGVRAESAMPAVELLSELAAIPLLSEGELEVERSVILQEIADGDENPGSRADALLHAALFSGHRLGTGVAGKAADLRKLTHADLLRFRDRQWSPAAGVVVMAGNLDHVDHARLEELMARIPDRPPPPAPAAPPRFVPRVEVEQSDGSVVHLRLSYEIPGLEFRRRSDRAVAEVFSQLLGGPASSRLFDELRERRGLCYWIDGWVWGFENASFLSIDCSVNPADLDEAFERIQAILMDLRTTGPTDEETSRFRSYSGGAATLDFESVNSRLSYATELIMEYDDHDVDPILLLRQIESVTQADLAQLAAAVMPRPCIGCVGPVTNPDFV
jgi:predicted Zn-dependent peptidase